MVSKHLKWSFWVAQLLVLMVWIAQPLAAQVGLAWDAPTPSISNFAGYRLYYGQGSLAAAQSVNVGTTTTYTKTGLVEGQTYAFAVTAYDTSNNESSKSNVVTITIPTSNHAPTAVGETVTDTAGTPVTIDVLANDTDSDGNPLSISTVTQGANGGSVTISGGKVIYTPPANFTGTDNFSYTITDGQGGVSTATVFVTVAPPVAPPNGAPSASNDTVSIPVGTSITIAVLLNDTDPNGDALSITAVTNAANGTVTWNPPSKSIIYTPAITFVGNDKFTYTVQDGKGGVATATVNVTVLPGSAASLVAAYSFNEGTGSTVTDSSGYNNKGQISKATWTTSGKFGKALVFNGTSALVTIPNAPSLQLTTGMTLEAWVKPSKVTSAWRDVIYKGNDIYFLEATSPPNRRPGGGITLSSGHQLTYGSYALSVNTWTHLALTYDGTILRLYVNGTQVSSRLRTGALLTSTNPLQIGGDSLFGQYFQGTIDEVRIYNQALLPSEILADMSAGIK